MNQLDSVVKTELRIAKLINTHKVAMIGSDAIFKKYKKYECKVLSLFFSYIIARMFKVGFIHSL